MSKFDWKKIAEDLLAAAGGEKNIKSFQHCATRFRFEAVDDKKVDRSALKKVALAKGVNKEGAQWQVIFGAGTVNKVHDAFEKIISPENKQVNTPQKPWWDSSLSFWSNLFMALRRGIRGFADIFIPLIPVFIAGGLSLALTSLINQVSHDNPTSASIAASKFFEMIGGGILGSLPAFVGWTAMKKFGGTPAIGLAIGIIMVFPGLLNGWVSSSNYVVTGFNSHADVAKLKADYIFNNNNEIYKTFHKDLLGLKVGGMYQNMKVVSIHLTNDSLLSVTLQKVNNGVVVPHDFTQYGLVDFAKSKGLVINEAKAFFPDAPKFFRFAFIGYQAQVFPTLGIIAVASWIEKLVTRWSHESFAIISVPLITVLASIFLGFLFIGPLGRAVGYGITYAFQGLYKYTNWPGFGLGGALIGAAYPFLVVTGLHQGFVPVEASLIADTTAQFNHGYTWITAVGSVSNVAEGMVGATLAVMLWKKSPKAGSTALSGSIAANLGITEPILFGVTLPTRFGLIAASAASAVGGYYVGMTHTVANSMGSASWLGLILQFDYVKSDSFDAYLKEYGFHTTQGLSKLAPIVNEAIALGITTIASMGFTLWFAKTWGKKDFAEFVEANQ